MSERYHLDRVLRGTRAAGPLSPRDVERVVSALALLDAGLDLVEKARRELQLVGDDSVTTWFINQLWTRVSERTRGIGALASHLETFLRRHTCRFGDAETCRLVPSRRTCPVHRPLARV